MDREVNSLAAAKLKAQRVASERGQTCTELHSQCQRLKTHLRAVMSDQRRLVVRLGVAEQKAQGRAIKTGGNGAAGNAKLGGG